MLACSFSLWLIFIESFFFFFFFNWECEVWRCLHSKSVLALVGSLWVSKILDQSTSYFLRLEFSKPMVTGAFTFCSSLNSLIVSGIWRFVSHSCFLDFSFPFYSFPPSLHLFLPFFSFLVFIFFCELCYILNNSS